MPLSIENALESIGSRYDEAPNSQEWILDLTEQLINEEQIKRNYEQALEDIRNRLQTIELQDNERRKTLDSAIAEQRLALDQSNA